VHLHKTLTVQGHTLTVAYRLENTGRQPIATHEYCHNFCAIDGHLLGPDYRLRVPYEVAFEDMSDRMPRRMLRRMGESLASEGGELWPRSTPERPFYRRLVGFSQSELAQWELVHLPSGVGVRELDDFSPARVAVWGTKHVISAEVFVDIDLAPGETMGWTRRYEFF
jgi:hypothetical protein